MDLSDTHKLAEALLRWGSRRTAEATRTYTGPGYYWYTDGNDPCDLGHCADRAEAESYAANWRAAFAEGRKLDDPPADFSGEGWHVVGKPDDVDPDVDSMAWLRRD